MGFALTLIATGLVIGYLTSEFIGALFGLFAALLLSVLINSRKLTN